MFGGSLQSAGTRQRGGGGRRELRQRGNGPRGRRRERQGSERPPFQRLDQVVGVLEAVVRQLGHHLADDVEEAALVGRLERRGRQLPHYVLVADRERGLAGQRNSARQALVRHHALGGQLAAAVGRLGPGLLGAHVV